MLREFTPLHRPPLGGEYYVFRDAVHNLIEIEDEQDGKYVRTLLQTPEVQRLRFLRQNGLSFLVYPGVETSRFPHSLGSFNIAHRIAHSLYERQPKEEEGLPRCLQLTKQDCLAFSIAALLHDIGHGPLSHVWEECWSEPRGIEHFHEKMGIDILTSNKTKIGDLLSQGELHPRYPDLGRDVVRFLTGTHHLTYLLPLLEGNLDVDRLDFIARDTRSAGVTYGSHDLEWIIRSFRFARLPGHYLGGSEAPRWVIAIDARKGVSALIQFLRARENMYKLVYHHKTTRAATQMLKLLFRRAEFLSRRGTLICRSSALQRVLSLKSDEPIDLDDYLQLDDSDIWMSLKGWARGESKDPILKDLASRVQSRDLFKVFTLSKHVHERLRFIDSPRAGHILRSIVKARVRGAGVTDEVAEYHYAFDEAHFDVIGRKQAPGQDVWIMQSGALGFEFGKLKDYWKEVSSSESEVQNLLVVHRDVVKDLAGIVERLSFPSESAKSMEPTPASPDKYLLIAPLGSEGNWKEVWVGADIRRGGALDKIVALKRYKTIGSDEEAIERDVEAFTRLGGAHSNLSSPVLAEYSQGAKDTWIAEPLWVGSLEDMVNKHGPRRDILEILNIATQLFSGLASLHRHKLRHTDIKPVNCGIVLGEDDTPTYVLGDFGCISSRPNELPEDRRILGTFRTRAPEVISSTGISLKSDVWSLAATIYALCVMRYPFMEFAAPHHDSTGRTEMESKIRDNLADLVREHRQNVKLLVPSVLGDLLWECFRDEPERPSASKMEDDFKKAYTKLKERKDLLFSSAWQRAEDIVSRFLAHTQGAADVPLSEPEREEVEWLLSEDGSRFVPVNLQKSLRPLAKKS